MADRPGGIGSAGDRRLVDAFGCVCLLGYAVLAWYSRGDLEEPQLWRFFALMAWLAAAPLALFLLLRQRPLALSPGRLLCWAALFRLAGLFGVPLFEDDWYRYLWDGYRFAETGTPYGWAPAQSFADPTVPEAFQRLLDHVNYPDLPTVYGPTTQVAFLLSHLVAPGSLIPLQVLLIAADMVLIRLLLCAAPPRLVLLYAWCPLVVKEIAFTAHVDGLAVCLAFAALLLRRRHWPMAAAVCLAFAVGAKVFALLLVPFVLPVPRIARRDAEPQSPGRPALAACGVWLVFLGALGLLYAPFALRGGTDLAALAAMAQGWEFNSALYAVVAAVLPPDLAKALLGAVLLVAGSAYWRAWQRRGGGLPRGDWIYGALLLASPVVNPWYALWVLPFAVLFPSRWAWVGASALLLSYVTGANLGTLALAPFAQPAWVRPVEFGLILAALAVDGAARLRRRSAVDR